MFESLLAFAVLAITAVSVVALSSYRYRRLLLTSPHKDGLSEAMSMGEALAVPVGGSIVLFTIYVGLRLVPKEYFNVLISLYLSIFSVFALGGFLKPYCRPNLATGSFCVLLGVYFYWSNNWIANDILACAIAVVALESNPVSTFSTASILLIGLFFYDIFWVFGSDVMLTVAQTIDGPIKLLFPSTIFGDHSAKSLLGLGDVIVPGFFICQTIVFSRDVVKRGNLYLIVSLVAYLLSLINTIAVMFIYKHGQPALLFIVPWLLVSFYSVAAFKGDLNAAFQFDAEQVFRRKEDKEEEEEEEETSTTPPATTDADSSLVSMLVGAVKDLFGFGPDDTPMITGTERCTAEKKND